MSRTALQDAQWLKSLPQNLFYDFEHFFWNQPDSARAWFGDETTISETFRTHTVLADKARQ